MTRSEEADVLTVGRETREAHGDFLEIADELEKRALRRLDGVRFGHSGGQFQIHRFPSLTEASPSFDIPKRGTAGNGVPFLTVGTTPDSVNPITGMGSRSPQARSLALAVLNRVVLTRQYHRFPRFATRALRQHRLNGVDRSRLPLGNKRE